MGKNTKTLQKRSAFLTKNIIPVFHALEKRLHPVETGKVADHLYAVKSKIVNLYVYQKGEIIVFDAGYPQDPNLEQEFKKIAILPDKVSHLFLTHTDMDHAGRLDLFRNATIYLSEKEEQMINGTTCRMLNLYTNRPIDSYTLLRDNQVIEIGKIKVKAIETPGHTPGSMSYLVDKSILITGDTLTLRKGHVNPFFWPYNMDGKTQIESIKRLAQLKNISVLCTAHTGYTFEFESFMKKYSAVNPKKDSGN